MIFSIGVFTALSTRFVYGKKLSPKWINIGIITLLSPIILIASFKSELFLHLGAVINRWDNLSKSLEMFFYNPFGYGLGIAGPASWIGTSIESAWEWQIALSSVHSTHKFLPENWYVQILLEQGLLWLFLFLGVLFTIGYHLFRIMKKRKNFFSVGIFSAFLALCFMANFTHAFEEAATSYILFLLLWIYISQHTKHSKN